MKDHYGLPGNGFMSEDETSSILSHSMLEVLPMAERVDGLIGTDLLQDVTG